MDFEIVAFMIGTFIGFFMGLIGSILEEFFLDEFIIKRVKINSLYKMKTSGNVYFVSQKTKRNINLVRVFNGDILIAVDRVGMKLFKKIPKEDEGLSLLANID